MWKQAETKPYVFIMPHSVLFDSAQNRRLLTRSPLQCSFLEPAIRACRSKLFNSSSVSDRKLAIINAA